MASVRFYTVGLVRKLKTQLLLEFGSINSEGPTLRPSLFCNQTSNWGLL